MVSAIFDFNRTPRFVEPSITINETTVMAPQANAISASSEHPQPRPRFLLSPSGAELFSNASFFFELIEVV